MGCRGRTLFDTEDGMAEAVFERAGAKSPGEGAEAS